MEPSSSNCSFTTTLPPPDNVVSVSSGGVAVGREAGFYGEKVCTTAWKMVLLLFDFNAVAITQGFI